MYQTSGCLVWTHLSLASRSASAGFSLGASTYLTRDRKRSTSSSSLRTWQKKNTYSQKNFGADGLVYLTGSDETEQTRAASRVTRTDSMVRMTMMKSFWKDKMVLSHGLTIFGSVKLRWKEDEAHLHRSWAPFVPPRLSTGQLNLWVWLFNVSTLGARSQMFQPQLPEIPEKLSDLTSLWVPITWGT